MKTFGFKINLKANWQGRGISLPKSMRRARSFYKKLFGKYRYAFVKGSYFKLNHLVRGLLTGPDSVIRSQNIQNVFQKNLFNRYMYFFQVSPARYKALTSGPSKVRPHEYYSPAVLDGIFNSYRNTFGLTNLYYNKTQNPERGFTPAGRQNVTSIAGQKEKREFIQKTAAGFSSSSTFVQNMDNRMKLLMSSKNILTPASQIIQPPAGPAHKNIYNRNFENNIISKKYKTISESNTVQNMNNAVTSGANYSSRNTIQQMSLSSGDSFHSFSQERNSTFINTLLPLTFRHHYKNYTIQRSAQTPAGGAQSQMYENGFTSGNSSSIFNRLYFSDRGVLAGKPVIAYYPNELLTKTISRLEKTQAVSRSSVLPANKYVSQQFDNSLVHKETNIVARFFQSFAGEYAAHNAHEAMPVQKDKSYRITPMLHKTGPEEQSEHEKQDAFVDKNIEKTMIRVKSLMNELRLNAMKHDYNVNSTREYESLFQKRLNRTNLSKRDISEEKNIRNLYTKFDRRTIKYLHLLSSWRRQNHLNAFIPESFIQMKSLIDNLPPAQGAGKKPRTLSSERTGYDNVSIENFMNTQTSQNEINLYHAELFKNAPQGEWAGELFSGAKKPAASALIHKPAVQPVSKPDSEQGQPVREVYTTEKTVTEVIDKKPDKKENEQQTKEFIENNMEWITRKVYSRIERMLSIEHERRS